MHILCVTFVLRVIIENHLKPFPCWVKWQFWTCIKLGSLHLDDTLESGMDAVRKDTSYREYKS